MASPWLMLALPFRLSAGAAGGEVGKLLLLARPQESNPSRLLGSPGRTRRSVSAPERLVHERLKGHMTLVPGSKLRYELTKARHAGARRDGHGVGRHTGISECSPNRRLGARVTAVIG